MKIFWRLILPFVLAVGLAIGLMLELMGRSTSSSPIGFGWWRRYYLYIAAGLFVAFFLASLWKTLHWGKESEEYAELLKEEEADEEAKRLHRDHRA